MALKNKKDYAFVRNEDAPILPPPATEVGFSGWLWQNIFSSMADFKSASSSIRSIFIALITFLLAYFCLIQLYSVIDFAIISAVWSDPMTNAEGLLAEMISALSFDSRLANCSNVSWACLFSSIFGDMEVNFIERRLSSSCLYLDEDARIISLIKINQYYCGCISINVSFGETLSPFET